MVDMVVHRHHLPETIARICRILMKADVPLPETAELAPDAAPAAPAGDAPAEGEMADKGAA
jgi:acetyl-CoA carboxylase carboxyl transferase subunit beta